MIPHTTIPNDFDTIVMAYQAARSFHVLFDNFVRPPLLHISQLVVQSTGVVVAMRYLVNSVDP